MSAKSHTGGYITLGADLSAVNNSLKSFGLLAQRVFDSVILDVTDVAANIAILQHRGKRFDTLYAHICPNCKYTFEGKEKTYDTAAAIMYDFVEGFIVSCDAGNMREVVDNILNLRMINDEYREIFYLVNENCDSTGLDAILDYVRFRDIDGLVLSNERQLRYVREAEATSGLKLYVNSTASTKDYDSLIAAGATSAFVRMKSRFGFHYVIQGLIIRLRRKRHVNRTPSVSPTER